MSAYEREREIDSERERERAGKGAERKAYPLLNREPYMG